MKQFILTLALAAICATGYSQLDYNEWEVVIITDDFGDPTGESCQRAFFQGVFSNSATSNSELVVKVIDYGSALLLELYEYARQPNASMGYQSTFGDISVKRADGTVETYRAFAPDSGGLYFDSNDEFFDMFRMASGETVKIVVREKAFSEYGSAVYVFEVDIP
jgi:hypothetical protein